MASSPASSSRNAKTAKKSPKKGSASSSVKGGKTPLVEAKSSKKKAVGAKSAIAKKASAQAPSRPASKGAASKSVKSSAKAPAAKQVATKSAKTGSSTQVGKPSMTKSVTKSSPAPKQAPASIAKKSATKVVVAKAPIRSEASRKSKSVPTPQETRPVKPEQKASKRLVRPKSSAGVPAVEPKGAVVRKTSARQNKGTGRPTMLEGELPQEYNVDRLVAIQRDPDWAHLYWELSGQTRQKLSNTDGGFRLRGFDTTGVLFDGHNASVALDIELAPYARSWYVKLPYQGRVYTFEYGTVNRDGEWNGLARSQPVGFEPGMLGLSPESEEWISIASDELFRAASGLADGEGIQDLIRRLRERSAGSGAFLGSSLVGESGSGFMGFAPSSFLGGSGLRLELPTSNMSSPSGSGTAWTGLSSGEFQPPKDKSKDFWLWVETELILYGATEPDAQVTLMGKPLQLNPDGTFRVHFPFPNGTDLHMDVRAVDKTGEMERVARPAAKRWTN
jgi:hypothetical protein